MKVFASNTNNDIYIGTDGNLATKTDLYAVMQAAQQASQAQLGEMIYAIDQGVPNFQTIWQSSANVAQFEAYLRRTILSVEGVTKITSLNTEVRDGTVFYTAEIETIYGKGAI